MKALFLGSLLLLALAGRQADAASLAPSCVVDCTNTLAERVPAAERMQSLCGGVARQRTLFQCLVNSCHAHAYGAALGHVVSACSHLGVDITPLHPVRLLYATHAKRQAVPTQPGPVLPGSSTLYSTQTLAFSHRLSMGLECRAGLDGLFTLSVGALDSGATQAPGSGDGDSGIVRAHGAGDSSAPEASASQTPGLPLGGSSGRNASTPCASSSLPIPSTLVPQSTPCPCNDQTSSMPGLQSASASLLRGPPEQQITPELSLTSSLAITQSSGVVTRSQSTTCDSTDTRANNVTSVPSRSRVSPLLVSATQIPKHAQSSGCTETSATDMNAPGASTEPDSASLPTTGARTSSPSSSGPLTAEGPCSNSSAFHTASAVSATSSSGLSVAGFSSRTDTSGSGLATPSDPIASGVETTSCSSDIRSNTFSTQMDASSAAIAQVPGSPPGASASPGAPTDVATTVSSRSPMPMTAITLTTVATSTSLSALVNSTDMSSRSSTLAPMGPPAYLPPLVAYSYNNPLPEYGNPSVSTSSSTFVTQKVSTPVPGSGSAGVMGFSGTTTTTNTESTLPYPFSYGMGPLLGASPSRTPPPGQAVEDGQLRVLARNLQESRAGESSGADEAGATVAAKTLEADATRTATTADEFTGGVNATTFPVTSSGGSALHRGLALVWAALAVALAAAGTRGS